MILKENNFYKNKTYKRLNGILDKYDGIDNLKINNVNIILNNFSKIAEKNPSLYQAYQSGDPSSLLEYYKENEKDKAKRKESVFKIWGKYFK